MANRSGSKSDREKPSTAPSDVGPKMAVSTVHEVAEVYVYIPPELSAAGVELKIVGCVRIINKVSSMRVVSLRA